MSDYFSLKQFIHLSTNFSAFSCGFWIYLAYGVDLSRNTFRFPSRNVFLLGSTQTDYTVGRRLGFILFDLHFLGS
jgi:hypothetical protein